MRRYRALVAALAALMFSLAVAFRPARVVAAADTLPQRLSDQEFWKLSLELSEPDGFFRSDNLLSNEIYYPSVIPELVRRTKPGGVYLGVGPEQNFNYITAIKPKMVFITDIRRGNLWTQLMYKALFELSKDRADFVGRLFTKKRPDGLSDRSSSADIINAYWDVVTSSETVFKENSQAIRDVLTRKHNLPLTEDDLVGITDRVYWYFYWYGLQITYNSSSSGTGRGNMTDYASLMIAQEPGGAFRSYLSTEEGYRFLKDLEERNLVVPVIGNFGGPKALRAVGKYVRDHGATVTAFYLSNVEQYLQQDGIWMNFCANVATMPLDASSTFIRSANSGGGGRGGGLINYLGSMQEETRASCPSGQPSGARVQTVR
jgi:hypothetical protein